MDKIRQWIGQKQQNQQLEAEHDERGQTARVLSVLIVGAWSAYLVAIIAGLYWGDGSLVITTLISSVFLLLPFWLLRRGQIALSGYIVVGIVLGTVTVVATLGQGIHDVAIMTYPIILIYASLALNRVSFRICVVLTFAAMFWLTFGEARGLFVSQPIESPNGVDFMVISAILSVALVVINLLVTNMRKNLELARSEILQRKRTEESLREKEVQYHTLADSGIALIWMSGPDKLCHYFNIPWLKFTGRTLEQEMGNGWAEGVHPDDFKRCLEIYVKSFDKREAFDMDYRLRHFSGEYRWIQDLGTPNYNSNGEFIGYIGHCFDITERKKAEDKFRMLFELSPVGLAMVDNETGEFLEVNEAVLHATGYTKDEFLELSYWDVTPREYEDQEMKQLQDLKETGRFGPNEKEFIRKDGTRYPLSISGALFVDQNGKQIVWGILEDITERKRAVDLLLYHATHDALTGIYNRAFFEEELARYERSRDYPISIIIADVDGLKKVNDCLGHAAGDKLLELAAKELSSVFRAGDVLARIGGDEFAAVLPVTDSKMAGDIVTRIREQLMEHNTNYPDFLVQLSIGAATAENGSLAEIFTLADQRMYADKAARKASRDSNQAG